MKLSALMVALPVIGLNFNAVAHHQEQHRAIKPLASDVTNTQFHGHHSSEGHERAPNAASLQSPTFTMLKQPSYGSFQVLSGCDLNALAMANSSQLLTEIKQQGRTCINELFSANDVIQQQVFTSDKMFAAANRAKVLASSYSGQGDSELEALFLYIRAGYYVEFYNDGVQFESWLKPAVKGAIDAFVNNNHFYDNNEAHGQLLKEVITTMDSSEQQDVYLPVIKQWLSRFDQNYANSRNMHRAINGIFTVLYRGQWNDNFKALIKSDTQLVQLLSDFTKQTWLIGADAEYLMVNAAGELARLKAYKNTPIQTQVDTALIQLFAAYKSYGYGDAIWLNAADVATYYADCSQFNICGFETQLTAQALSQTYQCSDTVKIRSQDMTAAQHVAACSTMAVEETRFHTRLATSQTPVADDNNTFLQVNIFNSSDDYKKYAKAIFKIDTNNGGMYLEGDPSKIGNQANFIAYEATYAKPEHFVWNLEHEYVHYLDGRFDLYGDFNAPTEAIVWWSEGVAEYIANLDDNQAAIDTIKDGSTYSLAQIFATTYAGFDQDRIYRWGYLAVRFMFERHNDELNVMLARTRVGDWTGYKVLLSSWSNQYENEFTAWTLELASGAVNDAPVAVINGPYQGEVNQDIQFSSQGSGDSDGQISAYLWQFGDGTQSNSENPSHRYVNAGDYVVSLTVTDNKGASTSVTSSVSITENNSSTPALTKGLPRIISAEQDSLFYYTFEVPAGATDLKISTGQGTGDVDLYVRFGSKPTLTEYDCRPYKGGNAEQCDIVAPQVGTYYVMTRGYNRYADVSLLADYVSAASRLPDSCQTQGVVTGGRVLSGQAVCLANQTPMWFSMENMSGQNQIRIETAYGSGDLSLEYSNSGWPNETNVEASSTNSGNNECISLSGQSQYWGYLKVSGAGTGSTLKVSYNDGGC
ncbi:collagenase [Pseudoalteromonas citrea]|uniref:microbial collagenase n=1 Tax=Pseudoalteromonas citrea TaxID=43655 RepID=A0A5S3XL53_9GAMM|nr:collagenase [Pseudoalteromonas citrea]TMP45447.1 collagenase [Pseudoalteromonas citrea]TMP54289.1 collagenase [Pseudoalteromonas citrea]